MPAAISQADIAAVKVSDVTLAAMTAVLDLTEPPYAVPGRRRRPGRSAPLAREVLGEGAAVSR
jgi:hypothetical protein